MWNYQRKCRSHECLPAESCSHEVSSVGFIGRYATGYVINIWLDSVGHSGHWHFYFVLLSCVGACGRLQAQGTPQHPQTYTSTLDVFRKTFEQDGIRGFYKGMVPTLTKVCLLPYDIFEILSLCSDMKTMELIFKLELLCIGRACGQYLVCGVRVQQARVGPLRQKRNHVHSTTNQPTNQPTNSS